MEIPAREERNRSGPLLMILPKMIDSDTEKDLPGVQEHFRNISVTLPLGWPLRAFFCNHATTAAELRLWMDVNVFADS